MQAPRSHALRKHALRQALHSCRLARELGGMRHDDIRIVAVVAVRDQVAIFFARANEDRLADPGRAEMAAQLRAGLQSVALAHSTYRAMQARAASVRMCPGETVR